MSHHHIHHGHATHRPSPLEISELADFDASLGDLPEDEKKRRRIFYLRDAIAQVEIGKTLLKGFGCIMIPMLLIPIFWPFIAFFWFMRKKAASTMDSQLRNALAYWNLGEVDVRPVVTRPVASGPPPGPPVIEAEVVAETTQRDEVKPARKRYRRKPYTREG